jgi:hypothetical protein
MLFSANTKCGHFHINKPRHGAMVIVVVLSAVDRGLEPRLKTIKLIVAHGYIILTSAVGVGQYNTSMQFKVPRENIIAY